MSCEKYQTQETNSRASHFLSQWEKNFRHQGL